VEARFTVRPDLAHGRHHEQELRREQLLQYVTREEALTARYGHYGRRNDVVAPMRKINKVHNSHIIFTNELLVVVFGWPCEASHARTSTADDGKFCLGDVRVPTVWIVRLRLTCPLEG
jgi:hypothetical protein